jgi:hypothetical protein
MQVIAHDCLKCEHSNLWGENYEPLDMKQIRCEFKFADGSKFNKLCAVMGINDDSEIIPPRWCPIN